jgi:hypothetical protein
VWPAHDDAAGWLPAGLVATGALTATQLMLMRGTAPYVQRSGRVGVTLSSGGALAARDAQVTILWSVSGDGALRPRAPAVGRALGGWLFTCQESGAARAYPCAGAYDPTAGTLEEPLVVETTPLPLSPRAGHFIPIDAGLESYLVSAGRVYRTVHRSEDGTVDGREILGYRLTRDWQQGGSLEIDLRPGAWMRACEPGDGLWLTRSCLQGDPPTGGSVTLAFRIVRVERHDARTRLVALDALALLAATVARRPLQLDPAVMTLAQAVDGLVGWAGLRCERTVTLNGALVPFQWQGGQSGLAALQQLLRREPVILRSLTAGVGEQPALWIGAPETEVTESFGSYGTPASHPLIRRVETLDATAPRLAVVHGWALRNDPSNGEEWALEAVAATRARLSPSVRPLPVYHLNRNWGSDDVATVAEGMRTQLEAGLRHGWFEAQAHLALEPHDRVLVDGEAARVAAIQEVWRDGRLIQRVELAE